jgi:hypothetical protein
MKFSLSPEAKKHLLIGGGLLAVVVIGIVVYKNFQVSSQASGAASNQATQDQLAYLETMMDNPYATGGGESVSDTTTAPTAPALPSITDEISQIEQAFGLAPASTASTTSSGSSTTASNPTPTAPSGSTPVAQPAPAAVSAASIQSVLNELPELREEGVMVA